MHPFEKAFIGEGKDFLGYSLRPYCPEVLEALKVIDSPFLYVTGRTYTAADLLLVLKIMSAENPLRVKLKPRALDRRAFQSLQGRDEILRSLAQALVSYLDDKSEGASAR